MGSQKLWEKHRVWVDGYRWYSHYDSKGGYAVSFVMRCFDMDFQSAVRELIGEQYTVNDTEPKGYPKKEKQGLEVPPKNATMQRVYENTTQSLLFEKVTYPEAAKALETIIESKIF